MSKRLVAICMLVLYSFILVRIMVFKNIPPIRLGRVMLNFGGTQVGAPNFIPFRSIWPYLSGERGLLISVLNLGGNIGLLVPVGFLTALIWRSITWKKFLILSVATGFVIEGMQVLLRVGIFDIDDILLNAFGVMIGCWMSALLRRKA